MSLKIAILPVTPYQQNCSILVCEQTNKAALIDPGGDTDNIVSALEQMQVELEKVFLTHGHLDHVGGATTIAERFNVPIEGPHEGDHYWLEQLEANARMMGFPPVKSFVPTVWLKDGDDINFGNITLKVIHCPGHTPGHVVFYYPEKKIAFVGDVLFQGSIGRTDFPGGNHQTLIDSITKKLWPLGDDVQFVPGHGPASTFGHERATNPFVADSKFG